jgi:hypothetical protein
MTTHITTEKAAMISARILALHAQGGVVSQSAKALAQFFGVDSESLRKQAN